MTCKKNGAIFAKAEDKPKYGTISHNSRIAPKFCMGNFVNRGIFSAFVAKSLSVKQDIFFCGRDMVSVYKLVPEHVAAVVLRIAKACHQIATRPGRYNHVWHGWR